jgi:hypothetical protein
MLYVNRVAGSSPAPSPHRERRRITRRYLAHNKLNARARAQLARDIIAGRVELAGLMTRQAACLCRVCTQYVRDDRPPHTTSETLAAHFSRSSLDERIELVRTAGVDTIWDQLVEPFLS